MQLAEHMADVGRALLKKNADAAGRYIPADHFVLLYHVPPYNSIDHLHVHCFELPFKNWKFSQKYAVSSFWCASHEAIIERLKQRMARGDNAPGDSRL